MRRLHVSEDDENILDSDELLDDPDDLLLEEQDDDSDADEDQLSQQHHPQMSLDEEIAAEKMYLAVHGGKQSDETGSTTDAIWVYDEQLVMVDRITVPVHD